jgi:hypothetical protein
MGVKHNRPLALELRQCSAARLVGSVGSAIGQPVQQSRSIIQERNAK